LLLPFMNKVAEAEVDRELERKLLQEAPGILRWALDGARAWYERGGLIIPQAVRDASTDSDTLGGWIEEKCDTEPGNVKKVECSTVPYRSWCEYAKAAGEHPGSRTEFNHDMDMRGFPHKQIKALGTKGFIGIKLKPDDTAEEDDQ
jgi:putative DNA primase/helicase